MPNKVNFNFLFSVFLLFFIISCNSLRTISSNNLFSGYLYDSKKELFNLKYRIDFDSSNNIQFRIYNVSGIKFIDLIITPDTCKIKYLLDNTYRNDLVSTYNNLKNEFCVYYIIYDLFKGNLFDKNDSEHCYRKIFIKDNYINISSLKNSETFGISGNGFKWYSNLNLPSFITICFHDRDYVLTIAR